VVSEVPGMRRLYLCLVIFVLKLEGVLLLALLNLSWML
jgi:hypothetical protein